MDDVLDIKQTGALSRQPEGADVLTILLDGRGRTATELAEAAGISRSKASFHLDQLVDGGLVRIDRQGRHRYYRLAGPEAAGKCRLLLGEAGGTEQDGARFGPRDSAMRQARMCYDHLAGELGFGITESLVQRGALLEDGENFKLTEDGERIFADLGIDVAAARRRRRHFARSCLDWSERRPHLAGALGAALAEHLLDWGWISHEPGGRTVRITSAGRREIQRVLDVEISDAGPSRSGI